MRNEMPLDGKVALVTGGSRGIGRAVALALAERGADIDINFRTNWEAADEVARAVEGRCRRALAVLVRYLAVELGLRGITVNAVNPSLVETDSARFYKGDGYAAWRDRVAAATPNGRVGFPEDIARAIALFCSPDAAWITGQRLVAGGGLTLTAQLCQ